MNPSIIASNVPLPTDEELREQTRAVFAANTSRGFSKLLKDGYAYVKPSPVKYPFQWFWDTCFHVFILCALGEHAFAKDNLRSLFAMQESNGFVGHMIFWKRLLPTSHADVLQSRPTFRQMRPHMSALIQPSFVAQALLRIMEETNDTTYLREMLPNVKRYLQWLADNRDFDGDGLISIISPFESGIDFKPSFDEVIGYRGGPLWTLYAKAAWVDYRNFIRRYQLPRIAKKGYFRIKEATVNTAYAYDLLAAAALCRMADDRDAEIFEKRAATVTARMREVMYDEQTAAFYDTAGADNRKLKVLTPTILFPALLPGMPRELLQKGIEMHLRNGREFALPFPVPSVARSEPSFDPDDSWYLWRGPTWAFMNWFLCRGLLEKGFEEDAQTLIVSLKGLIARGGFREFYDPYTAKGEGEKRFTWSGLVLDMLRLSERRNTRPARPT